MLGIRGCVLLTRPGLSKLRTPAVVMLHTSSSTEKAFLVRKIWVQAARIIDREGKEPNKGSLSADFCQPNVAEAAEVYLFSTTSSSAFCRRAEKVRLQG